MCRVISAQACQPHVRANGEMSFQARHLLKARPFLLLSPPISFLHPNEENPFSIQLNGHSTSTLSLICNRRRPLSPTSTSSQRRDSCSCFSSAGLPQLLNGRFSFCFPQRNPQTSSAPLWSSRLPQHRRLLRATHAALLKVRFNTL
jgi:hypothetical protein